MALAKVSKVVHAGLVLADSGDQKGIRVSVAVNAVAPKEGDSIEIGTVTASKRPVPKGDALNVLDANMIGTAKAPEAAKK